MATIPLDLNGYTDLPPGHIANFVTYLEMAPPESLPESAGAPYRVSKVEAPSLSWYRAIYRRVGDRWLWVGRAMMEDAALSAWLTAPTTELLALEQGDETMGFAELDWSVAGNLEVAMFGVVPEATGKGAAALLMRSVQARARDEGVRRIWLHTCTFDHPAAIPFYRRAGFRPYKFAIEVMPDPRLTGQLPREAGPHVPLIDPK
jgi:GNAT superfamily N-acetyltransferase